MIGIATIGKETDMAIISFKYMAQRADNAVTQWRNMLANDGFTADEADAILRLYLQENLVRLDWGIGRYSVKHGAFLNADVLNRALEATT
jgi:hypothetical protein